MSASQGDPLLRRGPLSLPNSGYGPFTSTDAKLIFDDHKGEYRERKPKKRPRDTRSRAGRCQNRTGRKQNRAGRVQKRNRTGRIQKRTGRIQKRTGRIRIKKHRIAPLPPEILMAEIGVEVGGVGWEWARVGGGGVGR